MKKMKIIFKMKSCWAIICSLMICAILLIIRFDVFGAQSNVENQETTKHKTINLKQVDDVLYTVDDPALEEMVEETLPAETEPEITKIEEVKPVIIPVEKLVISKEDLSVKEEENPTPEVVEAIKEETMELPVNEISKLVYGIDVSKWQGNNIDWAKVKADGIEFVMIKMGGRSTGSDGELYVDSCFERNIQGALANGIQVGIYFFSQAVNEQEALEEASMVISYIKKYQITYPVAFDWEAGSGYRVNDYGISADLLTKIASVFCDTVKSNGYTPMTYFCRNDWYNSVNGAELTSKYKSWLAVYWGEYYNDPDARNWYDASSQELPNFRYSYQMWQYTSRGHVAGISGRVDMNIALFTYANYKVDTTPVQLNVPNASITTNVGVPIDLMAGVSATNSIGYDSTSSVSLAVIDRDGDDVSGDPSYAISNPGKYTLNYSFVDPTGEKKEVSAILTVRGMPTITVDLTSIEYKYDAAKSATTNYTELINILKKNVTAVSYEGAALDVQITGADSQLTLGSYTILYSIDDKLGLTNTVNITVTINRGSQ